MSKHARRPARDDLSPSGLPFVAPGLADCLFHRCEAHSTVRQLNANEEQTGSECGACVAEEVTALEAVLLLVLDGYGERLQYAGELKRKLTSARDRLNFLSPGAGDFLDAENDDGNERPDRR